MGLMILHQPNELLHHARIDFRAFARIDQHRLLRIEEGDDVDIGRIVELAPAVFSEGEERQTGVSGACFFARKQQLTLVEGLSHEEIERSLKGGIGEVGECFGRLGRGPDAACFGHGRQKRGASLGYAQCLTKACFIRRGCGFSDGCQKLGEDDIRPALKRIGQPIGMRARQFKQDRAPIAAGCRGLARPP